MVRLFVEDEHPGCVGALLLLQQLLVALVPRRPTCDPGSVLLHTAMTNPVSTLHRSHCNTTQTLLTLHFLLISDTVSGHRDAF